MLPTGGHSLPAFGGKATSPEGYLLGLWAHECERVFADKLISKEDKSWVKATIVELCKQVGGLLQCGGVPALCPAGSDLVCFKILSTLIRVCPCAS